MRISLASLASRPGRRAATTLALLLLLGGCETDASGPDQPAEGLLALSTAGAPGLEVIANAPDGAVAIALPRPQDGATWVSAGQGGILVAATTEGQLVTSDPVDPRGSAVDVAALGWQPVEATDEAGGSVPTPAWFPTWDPGGERFAALGGDISEGAAATLLIIDPGKGTLATVVLKQAVLPGPPVWLGADRIALLAGNAAEPTSILVDTASGKVSKGPPGERRLATSADGKVIATTAGAGTPVILRSSKGWLADDGTSIGSVEVPKDFTEATALALDATGERLAIVWLHGSGTTQVDVHDGTDGWRRVLSHGGDLVAWLR